MNSAFSLSLVVVITTVLCVPQSEAISCYLCSGLSTTAIAGTGCLATASFQKNGAGVSNTTGCAYCSTVTNTYLGVITYARTCEIVAQITGCRTTHAVTTCFDTCDKDFCNDSTALRYTMLTSVIAVAVLAVSKVMH